uniref:Glycerol-3-phosphate acyltransferase 4 n=1 Tax=Angiostrongylus cantonensis TaxID=6313 RepID=A0A0K0DRF9_ANGCA
RIIYLVLVFFPSLVLLGGYCCLKSVVSTKIYPIAMKYDSRFGDPFWNSSSQSWCEYMFRMMTSWAIICNVYYLAPMEKLPDEDATAFASRVKKSIAFRGGLLDLEWDGGLKRARVHPKLVAKQQERKEIVKSHNIKFLLVFLVVINF